MCAESFQLNCHHIKVREWDKQFYLAAPDIWSVSQVIENCV